MLIKVRGLEHSYMEGTPFENQVLYGVDLDIEEGEMVGLIGPTQSGKSTLIQYLNGLFIPKIGEVVVDGIDVREQRSRLRKLRQKVGLVFQYPEHQLFEETVGKDVAFGPKNLGLPEDEVRRRVDSALEAVGLDPEVFRDRYIFALSGGQKRRVAIAGVLALNPRVMIFDDPTAGLDPRGREEILATIKKLHSEQDLTVIFVSNSLEDIARLVDRLIVLAQGKVIMSGTPREVFSQVKKMREIGMGILQTVDVMSRLRDRGWDVATTALTVEEACDEILACFRKKASGEGRE